MNKLFIVIIILLSANISFSQSIDKNETSDEIIKKNQQIIEQTKGTYQVQVLEDRGMPSVPITILKTVEDLRSENDTVFHSLSSYVRIMILPRTIIEGKDFLPIEYIKYINY